MFFMRNTCKPLWQFSTVVEPPIHIRDCVCLSLKHGSVNFNGTVRCSPWCGTSAFSSPATSTGSWPIPCWVGSWTGLVLSSFPRSPLPGNCYGVMANTMLGRVMNRFDYTLKSLFLHDLHFTLHVRKIPIYVFLFWELRCLSPSFHIQVSVSDLYILRRSTYFPWKKRQTDPGNI